MDIELAYVLVLFVLAISLWHVYRRVRLYRRRYIVHLLIPWIMASLVTLVVLQSIAMLDGVTLWHTLSVERILVASVAGGALLILLILWSDARGSAVMFQN